MLLKNKLLKLYILAAWNGVSIFVKVFVDLVLLWYKFPWLNVFVQKAYESICCITSKENPIVSKIYGTNLLPVLFSVTISILSSLGGKWLVTKCFLDKKETSFIKLLLDKKKCTKRLFSKGLKIHIRLKNWMMVQKRAN